MAKHKPAQEDGESRNDNPALPGGLIPVEEWGLAEASVRRTLMGRLRHWLEQLRAGISRQEEAFHSMDSLPELSSQQLQRLAPEPDRAAHGQALADAVGLLRQQDHCRRSVVLLVAPPFSGVSRALRCFPDYRDAADTPTKDEDTPPLPAYRIILPPDNLLMDAAAARQWWEMQPLHEPWVISELAVFWRRHCNGLALVEELLRRVAQNCAGEGVIGCNSWCWQFWSSYYPDAQLAPWMPAPMTTDRLGVWLQQLADNDEDAAPVVRMATDGRYVLPLEPEQNEEKPNKKRENSDLLSNLAADSRGIPGVALAIWRSALRARPETDAEDDAEKARENTREGSQGKENADCWIVPLDQLSLPTMPVSSERNLGLVLHAMLMHDGLTIAGLELVTAMPEPNLSLALARLARADIIACGEPGQGSAFDLRNPQQPTAAHTGFAPHAVWRVTPLGYPSTRRHLHNWGFPVDSF